MSQEQHNHTVLKGAALGFLITLVVVPGLYLLLPQFDQELAPASRVSLGINCLAFPGLFYLALLLVVGSQRFGSPAENPVLLEANSEQMKIDLRVLSNTTEQIIVFAVTTLCLAIALPFEYLSLLPVYSGWFVAGRLCFWIGYRQNVLWRAPGFAMNVLPAALGLLYCCAVLLFG